VGLGVEDLGGWPYTPVQVVDGAMRGGGPSVWRNRFRNTFRLQGCHAHETPLPPLGPFSRPMRGAPWLVLGAVAFLMSEVAL